MVFLSQRALEGLRNYKYKPANYTVLDDLHQPIWNCKFSHLVYFIYILIHLVAKSLNTRLNADITAKWLPSWLAPNLITLTGLMTLVASYILLTIYNVDFDGISPRWSYLLAAIAVFVYLHLDCLDGKQARATGTSSPLGQLFDHGTLYPCLYCNSRGMSRIKYKYIVGCDAFAVHLILLTLITTLQLAHDWKTVVSLLYVFVPWWMAHWEEYHTGVMSYGSGLWGVTEANYAVFIIHMLTYLFGPAFWTSRPLDKLVSLCTVTGKMEYLCRLLASLQLNYALLLIFGVMGASLFIQQVIRVFRLSESDLLLKTHLPKDERGNKDLGRHAALNHLLQILWSCFGCGVILMLPIVPKSHSRIIFEIFGVNYALQATRMIMSHMSKEPFQIAIWSNVLIGVQIFNYFAGFMDPVTLSYIVFAGIFIGYLHYIISIISEICAFLGISALKIKPSNKKDR